jgi:hypothetical protein
MTLSSLPNNDSSPDSIQPNISKKQPEITVEVIRALTPILIAAIGGVIGIVVLLKTPDNQAGFGLASTAIAGAAGLAQSNKDPKEK